MLSDGAAQWCLTVLPNGTAAVNTEAPKYLSISILMNQG